MSPAWSDSSDSLAAVDFVSAAEAPVQSRRTDLSRFEESDDDEPPRVGKPSKPGKPTLKRRRGEDPSKAEKASARKADVAAVVDQILAAKAKKEAKGLKTKTSKLTEKAPASLRMPAASQVTFCILGNCPVRGVSVRFLATVMVQLSQVPACLTTHPSVA